MDLQLPFSTPIGIFRVLEGKKVLTRKELNEILLVGLTDTDSGYLRWDGVLTFTPKYKNCGLDYYDSKRTFNLVIGLKLCTPANILKHIQSVLSVVTAKTSYQILSTSVNQEQIRIDENLTTDLDLFKIVFEVHELTANPCEYVLECVC